MFRGIYTAANSMNTASKKIDTIVNNISNVDTTGFKKDIDVVEAFSEKLLYKRRDVEGYLRASKNNVSIKSKDQKDGSKEYEIDVKRGYLSLEDKNGKGFYKSAKFVVDEDGYLRTGYRNYNSKAINKFGSYLLDTKGNRVKVDSGDLNIDSNGYLLSGGTRVSKIIDNEPSRSIGTINQGTLLDRVMTNYKQGAQEQTDNPMHISLEGEGFIKVKATDGTVKYSRGMAMTMDENRILKDYLGSSILTDEGEEIQIPEDSKTIIFSKDGTIYSENGDNERLYLGRLALVDIENKEDLEKYGHGYFQESKNGNAVETDFTGKVLQGYLERSNVNQIDEMVEMISSYRAFEINQKVINSYDHIMQVAANDLGKI